MDLLLRTFSDCKEDCVSIMLGSLFHRTVIAVGIQSATDRVESRVRRVASSFLFLFLLRHLSPISLELPSIRWTVQAENSTTLWYRVPRLCRCEEDHSKRFR